MPTQHPLLVASAVAHLVLSLGHTTKGLEQFKHPSLNQIPAVLRSVVKIGWYEGSAWFLIASVLNYKWAQTGLVDTADKTIAGLLTSLLVGAGVSYFKSGDNATAGILTIIGFLQGLAAKSAAL